VKFALDTNVFVDAFRDETVAEALAAFLEQALAGCVLPRRRLHARHERQRLRSLPPVPRPVATREAVAKGC
jgi:predicted nucleic acid-binding protein